jgi:hypothetical protein
MASKPKLLTREEFASLLTVGSCSVIDPPAAIPAQHGARLIGLGYMVDIAGRLRMTTPGRQRIAAGFDNESRLAMVEFQRTSPCDQAARVRRRDRLLRVAGQPLPR